jgi:cytochrome b subunit of formate dehydrogenase
MTMTAALHFEVHWFPAIVCIIFAVTGFALSALGIWEYVDGVIHRWKLRRRGRL